MKLPLIAFQTSSLTTGLSSSELPLMANDRNAYLSVSVSSLLQNDRDVIVSEAPGSLSYIKWFLVLWSLM